MKKLFQRKATLAAKNGEEHLQETATVTTTVALTTTTTTSDSKPAGKKSKGIEVGSPATPTSPVLPVSDPIHHKNTCHCCGRKVGRLQFAVKKKLKLIRCRRCQQKVCGSCSTRSICAKCKIKYESRSKLHSPSDVARLSDIEMERLMYALDIAPAPASEQLATDIFTQLERCTVEPLPFGGAQNHHATGGHEAGEPYSEESDEDTTTHSGSHGPASAIAKAVASDRPLPTEVESLSRITTATYFETLSLNELRIILDQFQVHCDEFSTWRDCVQLVTDLWLSYVDVTSTSSESGSLAPSVSLQDIARAEDINTMDVDSLRTLLDNHDVDYNDCWIKWELAYRVKRLWTILNADIGARDELENNLCVSCLCSPINCSVFPCGHKATCLPCGRDLGRCPICCGPVDKVMPFAVARRTGPGGSASSAKRVPPPPPPLKPSGSFR